MRSFSPFYGLPVSTLQERLTEVEKIEETFTLVVHDGKIELQWNDDYARDVWIASRSRADKQINLMEPFIALLPSFRWVASGRVMPLHPRCVLGVYSRMFVPSCLLTTHRATFTIHDQPTILLDHARQQELLTAAKHGTVSTHPNENDRFEQDWHAACAPTDPINQEGYEELREYSAFCLICVTLWAYDPCTR
jgi:beta-1,2-xylosyltransferase